MVSQFLEQNLISIVTIGASVIYFISKIESNSKAQKAFFESEISHLAELIRLNHENLKGELQRLKERNEDNIRNIKEDILDLRQKQAESNNIKERLAVAEASVKSLHHRVDDLAEDKSEE